jgi:hypothetical protein
MSHVLEFLENLELYWNNMQKNSLDDPKFEPPPHPQKLDLDL